MDISHGSDINECQLGDVQCVNSDCVNTNGSYMCACLTGFQRNNVSDIQSSCSM